MCDSFVALGAETASGHTLFAKNSDRKPDECQPFVQIPAAHHAPGSRLRCTHVAIPQVAETYAVMGHSPWWVWGFEQGVNEHGVAIGNQAVFSNEPLEEAPGLIGMDLVRLGLERGRSAREALEVIATLVEGHGQGGPAFAPGASGYHNSFLLADSNNAWRLETSNRRWAARQVSLAACSNHYALASDWEIASRDLERWVREQGYWPQGGRVDFAAALRNPHVPAHLTSGRARRADQQLRAARGSLDVAALAALVRDHGSGGGVWTGGDADPSEERFFTLCAHSAPVHETTATLIAELPAHRPFGWPVWVGFGTPCTGFLLPVYLDATLPACLARRVDAPDAPAAWPRLRRLDAAAAADPQRATPVVRAGWAALEREVEHERGEVERQARSAAAAGDPEIAREHLAAFMDRTAEAMIACADEITRRLPRLREPAAMPLP